MGSIDSEIKSKLQNDKHRFVTNLVFTSNWLQHEFTKELKPFGISTQQYNILRILKGSKDWLPMSDIKDGLLDKSPNTTRLTDKLLGKGLIERNRSETDRRVVFVRITKAGSELFAKINAKENSITRAMAHNISDAEAKTISDILDKFRG